MKGIAKREFLFLGIFFGLHLLGSGLIFSVDCFLSPEYRALITYGVSFLMAVIWFGKMLLQSFKKLNNKDLLCAFVVLLIVVAGIIASNILLEFLGVFNSNEAAIDQSASKNGFIVGIIAILLAPVTEEIAFRGILFKLFSKINQPVAYIGVALLFGFFHVWDYVLIDGDLMQLAAMLPYVIMSIGFCYAHQKTNNLGYAVAMHMLLNLYAS